MVELIAHRAGNEGPVDGSLRELVDRVEIDVHLHRGRLVVRHAKRVWFTSRLWERWYLLPAGIEVPTLDERLTALDGLELWIDGKGVTFRLLPAVLAALTAAGWTSVSVSTKSWWALRRIAGRADVRIYRSAGNRFERWLLEHLPSRVPLDGVVLHSRLLDEDTVARLRRRFGSVVSWAIPDVATGRRLVGWGVSGLIVDDREVLVGLQGVRARTGGD